MIVQGGDLAVFSPAADFRRLLSLIRPQPTFEYWVHNGSESAGSALVRKSECLTVSWWSSSLGQVPCFAQLGWICEFVPPGARAARPRDVHR